MIKKRKRSPHYSKLLPISKAETRNSHHLIKENFIEVESKQVNNRPFRFIVKLNNNFLLTEKKSFNQIIICVSISHSPPCQFLYLAPLFLSQLWLFSFRVGKSLQLKCFSLCFWICTENIRKFIAKNELVVELILFDELEKYSGCIS